MDQVSCARANCPNVSPLSDCSASFGHIRVHFILQEPFIFNESPYHGGAGDFASMFVEGGRNVHYCVCLFLPLVVFIAKDIEGFIALCIHSNGKMQCLVKSHLEIVLFVA